MLGVVVFAHGSRDPLWRAPVEAVARTIAERDPQALVISAYLELCEPDMPSAVAALVARGATTVRVLPLFFGMGKHAREDLPGIMRELAERHPGVQLQQLPTAGEDPRLTALLAQIALERRP